MEIGWGEVGWDPQYRDRQVVFVFDFQIGFDATQHWHFFPQYQPDAWNHYYVDIGWNPATTKWEPYIWYNGAWTLLVLPHQVNFSWTYAGMSEQNYETNDPNGSHWWTPQVNYGDLACCRTQIYDTSVWSWRNWDSSYPTTTRNLKDRYEAHWNTNYYDWYGHSH